MALVDCRMHHVQYLMYCGRPCNHLPKELYDNTVTRQVEMGMRVACLWAPELAQQLGPGSLYSLYVPFNLGQYLATVSSEATTPHLDKSGSIHGRRADMHPTWCAKKKAGAVHVPFAIICAQ